MAASPAVDLFDGHLRVALFDAFTADDRWLGFGYLGERRNALQGHSALVERVPAIDALVIAHATAAGWDADTLFHWANSKDGRWFADVVFGGSLATPLSVLFAEGTRYLNAQAI